MIKLMLDHLYPDKLRIKKISDVVICVFLIVHNVDWVGMTLHIS